jgi:hypothetical protein
MASKVSKRNQVKMKILISFATSYLFEVWYSAVATLNSKYRSQINVIHDLKVAVSETKPGYTAQRNAKQAQPSHWNF